MRAVYVEQFGPPEALRVQDADPPSPAPGQVVVAVEVAVEVLENVPEAPLPGAVNVTVAPETALPYWSVTVATSGLVKAVLTGAVCPEPDVMAIVLAAPATLVSGKVAEVAPVAEAVTL